MAAQYTVGQVLPNGATVTADTFVTLADGTTVETMTASNPTGSVDREFIVTPGAGTPAANQQTLTAKAQAALINNATFLVIGNPTQAQAVTQVQALTRQVNALIRLALNQFDTTTGT